MILGIDGRLANAQYPAGAGRYCRELIVAMGELDADVTLRVYLDRPPRAGFPCGADLVRVLPSGKFWTHRVLAKELRQHAPDVFFTPVTQLPWRCPCPTLVSVLDLAILTHPEHFPRRKRLAMTLKTRHAIKQGDHFIAISETTARDLENYFGITPDRITTAPLGVTDVYRRIERPPEGPHQSLEGLPERYILYVGQLQPRKNVTGLIRAYEVLCSENPSLPHDLVIAGPDGWQCGPIHRAMETSPVSRRIHRLGYVPEEAMPGLIAGADVLALVSLYEGFGLPVLEAMTAGTAVLVSDRGALPEVAGDGGDCVDPEDTASIVDGLKRLLLDDAYREDCEKRGRRRAEDFRWEHTARAVLDAARGLVR